MTLYFSTYYYIIVPNMESKTKFRPNPKLKLMEQVREVLRYHHYAYRTEKAYCHWILRFIHFFGGKTHSLEFSTFDIERFLSDLAVKQEVSASTQRQALNAIVFLYKDVLDKPLDDKIQPIRAKRQPKLPTVLGRDEIKRLFVHIDGNSVAICVSIQKAFY